ncbi:MAG TPA: hypothetical protein VFP12_00330 [Allosphingosinicella sp.]|nr:hypothetical protein [Allosphingosinicella sp.]
MTESASPPPPGDPPDDSSGERAPRLPAIPFDPVPVQPRRDGWTAAKQRRFIEVLAETGIVRLAAAAAGMSEASAHRLARRPDAAAFCAACDAALRMAARPAAAKLYEYALDGMTETVWRDGEIVYRRRRPSEKALIFLLSRVDPMHFGRPPPATAWTDGAGELIDTVAETADLFDTYLENLRDLPPEAAEDEEGGAGPEHGHG